MEWLLVLIICVIIFNKFVKKDKGVSDKAVTKDSCQIINSYKSDQCI